MIKSAESKTEQTLSEFFKTFGTHKNMVLSTASDGKIHSRMMSIVCIDNKFYFQTDNSFRKCRDIENNPHVSLCIDNIQIEGLCKFIGKPADNKDFYEIFSLSFPKAYELYTHLDNEVLYEINPNYIEQWIYENDKPYIRIYDIENGEYYNKKYIID